MKKKISVVNLILMCVWLLAIPINASVIETQAQIDAVTKEIETQNARLDEIQIEIDDIDEQIEATNALIAAKQAEIDRLMNDNAKLQGEIDTITKTINDSRDQNELMIRGFQLMKHNATITSIIFDENNDVPFYQTMAAINTLLDAMTASINESIALQYELNQKQEEIEVNLATVKDSQALMQENKKELVTRETELSEKQNEAYVISDSLHKEIAALELKQEELLSNLTENAYLSESDQTAVMKEAGISSSDYVYVDFIVSHESNWNFTATNSMSGAYGLCQALPPSQLASAGSDWELNPVTQMKWCDSYAQARYGSWANAQTFWIANNWW